MATAPWRTVCILYSVAAALAGCGERPPKVIGKAVGCQTSAPSGDATCPRTRSNPGQCTDTRLVRPAEGPTVEEEGIHYDSDCDSADGIGMLVPAASGVAASCAPACLHDADCPPNSACECTGRAGTCVFAQCLTNANCSHGSFCLHWRESCNDLGAFACTTDRDTCHHDAQCPDGTHCEFTYAGFQCRSGACNLP